MHPSMLGAASAADQRALFGAPLTFWCNLQEMNAKNSLPPAKPVYRQLEDVVGCKWSVSVLLAIAAGIARPGALERHIDGISTKVLSERLRKLAGYGLLVKRTYAEVPPRTEYSLTRNGHRLVGIVGQIRALDDEIRSRPNAD